MSVILRWPKLLDSSLVTSAEQLAVSLPVSAWRAILVSGCGPRGFQERQTASTSSLSQIRMREARGAATSMVKFISAHKGGKFVVAMEYLVNHNICTNEAAVNPMPKKSFPRSREAKEKPILIARDDRGKDQPHPANHNATDSNGIT